MTSPRRTFLGRLGALFALGATPSALAATSGETTPFAPDERWLLATAQREHKLFLENGTVSDGVALRRGLNFLEAYKTDYGVAEKDVGLVIGFHGTAISLALGDPLWAKYVLGDRAGVRTPSGGAAVANPFRRGAPFAMESLAARGVIFLACNNSLRRLAGQLAGPTGDAAAVHRELVAGVEVAQVVPAMAVAVSRAQARGIPYLTQD